MTENGEKSKRVEISSRHEDDGQKNSFLYFQSTQNWKLWQTKLTRNRLNA